MPIFEVSLFHTVYLFTTCIHQRTRQKLRKNPSRLVALFFFRTYCAAGSCRHHDLRDHADCDSIEWTSNRPNKDKIDTNGSSSSRSIWKYQNQWGKTKKGSGFGGTEIKGREFENVSTCLAFVLLLVASEGSCNEPTRKKSEQWHLRYSLCPFASTKPSVEIIASNQRLIPQDYLWNWGHQENSQGSTQTNSNPRKTA